MRHHFARRIAFTLTELLVVIALIIVLGGLGLGAAAKGYGWVKQRATETTMTKVLERIVMRRISDIHKDVKEWDSTPILYTQAGGDARRAEVLKLLYLYKWSFPQTYSEAWYNLQESKLLYDPTNGYTHAQIIWNRLSVNKPTGITPAQFIATPTAGEMSRMVKYQAAACLAAALASTRASSLDELGPDELGTPDEASGRHDLSDTLPAGARASSNRFLADAWGNPFFFLRHGNCWDNLGYRAPINRSAYWCGLVNPPVAPITAALGNEYYDILVNNPFSGPSFNRGRAFQAFPSLWNRDPFDSEGTLRNADAWQSLSSPAPGGAWLSPGATPPFQTTHLAPPGGDQQRDYFLSNFGYWPQPSDVQTPANDRWPQEFAPFVIISAGGDGLLTTWDDNLDSYRLKISVSGQQ